MFAQGLDTEGDVIVERNPEFGGAFDHASRPLTPRAKALSFMRFFTAPLPEPVGRDGCPSSANASPKQVVTELERGPLAHGYPTDMWTLARLRRSRRRLGLLPSGTCLEGPPPDGLEPPAPGTASRRARRRGDRVLVVAEDWPRVKETPVAGNVWICFEDESGFSLLPSVRSTWAPKGKTPVLQHRFSWKRLSMSAVVGYSADGSEAWLVFQMRPGSYNEETLIEFLGELHDHLDGTRSRSSGTACPRIAAGR